MNATASYALPSYYAQLMMKAPAASGEAVAALPAVLSGETDSWTASAQLVGSRLVLKVVNYGVNASSVTVTAQGRALAAVENATILTAPDPLEQHPRRADEGRAEAGAALIDRRSARPPIPQHSDPGMEPHSFDRPARVSPAPDVRSRLACLDVHGHLASPGRLPARAEMARNKPRVAAMAVWWDASAGRLWL